MALDIVAMKAEHLPAVRRFSEVVWKRPTSDAYYRWRYESAPFHRVWLALRDGECLAMEAGIQRPYQMGSETVDVLELFDWYTRPDLRNAGAGVRVMQAIMKEPHPLMLVGGSEDAQALLPRLNWTRVGTSLRFVLVLGAARTRVALEQRLSIPGPAAELLARAAVHRPGLRPRARAVPRGGRVIATARVGEEIQALYEDVAGTVARWTQPLLAWLLDDFPGIGHFVPLYFTVDEQLVGWSLLRIFPTALGCDGEIIELHAAPAAQPDPDLLTWMISETAVRAAAFGPGILGARTTCPATAGAFRRNQFRETSQDPVNFWLSGGTAPPDPVILGSNTNDAALVPFVERWWGDPSR